ncbi:hypothetical protein K474DRAFT_1656024 [Panus rudis PR-1116 ss-1]|nr:hypothetical protein K474DRAFT_1656024 [Panus rudis PR-1116 ss-1]
MASLRKLKAYVLGQSDIHASAEELQEAAIPVSTGDCRYCPDPCDEGHEEYPARFNVDFETQMLGSVKPYRRQVIIGTGKSDWPSHINLDFHSLASYLESAVDSAPKSLPPGQPSNDAKKVPGVFDSSTVTKISILNGSHHTVADDPDHDTVLILPDYKVVTNIERSKKGAQELFAAAVDPAFGRAGRVVEGSNVRSWVLPYSCVILLCEFDVPFSHS